MRAGSWALLMLVLGLAAAAALAPGAQARAKPKPKPKPLALLPRRSCAGLLGVEDFPGAATANPPGGTVTSSDDYSTCLFLPPEPPEGDPTPPTGGGGDTLHVFSKLVYDHTEKGQKGLLINLVETPPATTRIHYLAGVGTLAYIAESSGAGFGVVQVRNDVFTVDGETYADTGFLLKVVAHELCPACR